MAFAILRTAKLKSLGELGGSLSHNYRTRFTPNADNQRTALNEHDAQTADDAMTAIKNRLPEKLRKNGVLCVEHLITASPEWQGWKNKDAETEFFEQSRKWLIDKYGFENVITTSIHRDESTPHLIAYVVPRDDSGRLNARRWLGGRKLMSEMQTDFANTVKHLGLKRGVENSCAEHTSIRQFYSEINQPVKPLPEIQLSRLEEQPKSKFLTKNEVHGEKVIDAVYEYIAPQLESFENQIGADFSALAAQLNYERIKNKKLEKQNQKLIEVVNSAKEIISGYDQEFQVFQEYRSTSESKYESLKSNIRAEIDLQLKKENDALGFTVTAKTELEKEMNQTLKQGFKSRPQVDQVQQPERKEKGNDFDFSMQ